jgi:Flp pilus assembly protein TadG
MAGAVMRLLEEEDGSEAVEVAVCLPILLLMSFGVIQLMLFLACFVGATYGGRAAVRYAATHGAASIAPCTSTTLGNIVKAYAIGIPAAGVVTTSTWSPDNTVGSTVSVQVALTYSTGIPAAGLGTVTTVMTAKGTILQ